MSLMNSKQIIKNCAAMILQGFGLNTLYLKCTQKNSIRVLNYHNIEEKNNKFICDYLSVNPVLFEKHLNILLKKGFKFISFYEFEKIVEENMKVYEKSILLTFDDGSRTIYDNALPILRKKKIPFVLFFTSGPTINKENNFWWEKLDYCITNFEGQFELNIGETKISRLIKNYNSKVALYRCLVNLLRDLTVEKREFEIKKIAEYTNVNLSSMCRTVLSINELKELYNSGLCSVQGHTVTHRSLSTCNIKDIQWELSQNKEDILDIFGYSPVAFSFPGGVIAEEAYRICSNLGYKYIFTTSNNINILNKNTRKVFDVEVFDRTSIGTYDYIQTFLSKVAGTYSFIKRK